jgi:hypothetical protein
MVHRPGGEGRHGDQPVDRTRGVTRPRRPRPRRRRRSEHGRGGTSIGLAQLDNGIFELVHPPKVRERQLDFQEGMELWKAGDPEAARDALRYALSDCHDNLWVHVALGQIALREHRNSALARGHFGYAVELARKAIPRDFSGRLPRDSPNNVPFYEALEGLMQCETALGRTDECARLRGLRDRLSGAAS